MADGTVLQFPDGTPDAVVDKAASDYIGASKAPTAPSDAAPTSWLPDWLAKGPSWLPDSLSKPPGSTSVLDREPRPSQWPEAAVQAYQDTSILTPEGKEALKQAPPVVRNVVDPLLGVGNTLLGIYNAGGAALATGVNETAAQLGVPELGRDINMGMQVAPMAHVGTGVPQLPGPRVAPRVHPMMEVFDRMDAARAAPEPPPIPPRAPTPAEAAPGFVPPGSEVPISLRLKAAIEAADTAPPRPGMVPPGEAPPSRVQPGAAGPATVPYSHPEPMLMMDNPPWAPPQGESGGPRVSPMMRGFNETEPAARTATPPPSEPPGTQSAGAAASREGTPASVIETKTPTQALNDFATSVQQTVRDRARPGTKPDTIEDHNSYVPEVKRLESARVFDPEIAGNHDALMDIAPDYKAAVEKYEQENIHDVLKGKYQQMEGTDNTTAAIREQRNAVSPDALGVFQNERPVNGQPILDLINEIRDGPTGKSEAVTNTLNRIEKSLYDKNGKLEVLPSQYYGARKNLVEIRDSGPMTKEGAEARTARRELGRVGEVMDRVIGEGSNGYKDVYLPQWAHYSRLIDQQEYLQSKTVGPGKITGQDGNLTWNGVQKLLEQILSDKRKPGNSRAKTLTEEQLNEIVAIRNELAALKYRNDLAKSNGSPTVKKAAAAARLGAPVMGLSPEAIDAAIHTVLGKFTMGAGNAVYEFGVKPVLKKRRERAADAIMETTKNRLMNTDIPPE